MSAKSIITENVSPSLIEKGSQKIAWAMSHMPIINELTKEYLDSKILSKCTIVTSIHMEAKTACLVIALAKLGAKVYATGCNPLSTQDDIAAALSKVRNVTVYAIHDCDEETYWKMLVKAISHRPHIIIDDGGDLVKLLHDERYKKYGNRLIGGCEETTTGIHRLKNLERSKQLLFPMFNVNDADCKHNYDNHFGTGQSVVDGILRTTNLIIAGKTVVIAGYGDCGSGIAKRMHGLGAHVVITEIDPIKALKANMDGYLVMTMDEAAKIGDIFITATGCKDVIVRRHFYNMKNGAILANAGHFNVEINVATLKEITDWSFETTYFNPIRDNIKAYTLPDNKKLYLLSDGRLVNLAAADGHPVEIMDMSFSIQLLSVLHIARSFLSSGKKFPPKLHSVPKYIDESVAKIALRAQGIRIDRLTNEQRSYLENGF